MGLLRELPNPKDERDEPVVQVIDETTGETVYTVRVPRRELERGFRPRTFSLGPHTLRVRRASGVYEESGLLPTPVTSER